MLHVDDSPIIVEKWPQELSGEMGNGKYSVSHRSIWDMVKE